MASLNLSVSFVFSVFIFVKHINQNHQNKFQLLQSQLFQDRQNQNMSKNQNVSGFDIYIIIYIYRYVSKTTIKWTGLMNIGFGEQRVLCTLVSTTNE